MIKIIQKLTAAISLIAHNGITVVELVVVPPVVVTVLRVTVVVAIPKKEKIRKFHWKLRKKEKKY